MKKLLLIQGVFFQATRGFSIGYLPGIGSIATIEKALKQGIYSAIVGPDKIASPSDTFSGHMHDYVGYSSVTDLVMTESELTFTKNYPGRHPIYYEFKEKKGNVWTGIWKGQDCGRGVTRCIVTEIEDTFVQMEESAAMDLLAQLN